MTTVTQEINDFIANEGKGITRDALNIALFQLGVARQRAAILDEQNADLLAALEEIVAECPNPNASYGKRIVEIARAAIERAKQ